jgi:hypothetical protein
LTQSGQEPPLQGADLSDFMKVIAGSAVSWPLDTLAQQSERVRRVGILMNLAAEDPEGQNRLKAFLQGLQKQGG